MKAQIQVLEQLVTNLTVTSAGTATPRLVQLHNFVADRKEALEDMVTDL